MLDNVKLFHGTKHPYREGDALMAGGIVASCTQREDGEPTPGCGCGCDGRRMVWATSDPAEAHYWARQRPCNCGDTGRDHRPRVFEVVLDAAEHDPNASANSVMGFVGRVISEVDMEARTMRDWSSER